MNWRCNNNTRRARYLSRRAAVRTRCATTSAEPSLPYYRRGRTQSKHNVSNITELYFFLFRTAQPRHTWNVNETCCALNALYIARRNVGDFVKRNWWVLRKVLRTGNTDGLMFVTFLCDCLPTRSRRVYIRSGEKIAFSRRKHVGPMTEKINYSRRVQSDGVNRSKNTKSHIFLKRSRSRNIYDVHLKRPEFFQFKAGHLRALG